MARRRAPGSSTACGAPPRAAATGCIANRPDSACLWDSAGGQTCIADLGGWQEAAPGVEPRTRIHVVGAGDPHAARRLRRRPREAFTAALTTGDETADGGLHWLGRADVLAPWLGDRTPA